MGRFLVRKRITIKVHEPDLKEKFFFFISGIVLSVPLTIFAERFSNILSSSLPAFYAAFFSIAISAPLIEEFAKAYPLFYRHGETERSIFIFGFLIGLGFGIVEFFIYVFSYGAPVMIRLPGIFFHAALTSIAAYGIAKKKSAAFYFLAVLLHFSNNFFALFGRMWFVGGATTIAVTFALSWWLYLDTSNNIIEEKFY